jgi:hypothetical protein
MPGQDLNSVSWNTEEIPEAGNGGGCRIHLGGRNGGQVRSWVVLSIGPAG